MIKFRDVVINGLTYDFRPILFFYFLECLQGNNFNQNGCASLHALKP